MVQQERARLTREKILLGAADVIRRVGYAKASLGQISETSGVTRGALYFHFGSKLDIAAALVDEQHRITREASEMILATDASALELMMHLCLDLAQRLVADPIVRAGVRLTSDTSTFDSPIGDPFRDWIETFGALATRAQDNGETTATVPPDMAARFIIPAFTGVQLVSDTLTGREDLPGRVREMWEILVRALVAAENLATALQMLDDVFTAPGSDEEAMR
ncbi:ScbR family autoregulator-binding transcription factor [Luethyella okanaganae]|uniref:ScbR family autoregulator-binding transcription factor n=1 Tax=Luethyella okanaganae TaxID=69372 RepID=A0ABW1VFY5_9MICO